MRSNTPKAPSNLSPPLQVCFLVKRSRGTLAMPPARRLWPEAPRRSRFRFFLPFQGPFWAQTSAKALIRFRAPWAGPLCGVGRQGGTCPGSLCHRRAHALRHTHRRCLRAGLRCGCFGGSGVSPSLKCRADLVVWSRRRSVDTNLPGRRQCPQCPQCLAWLAASPWCLGELSL